MAVVANTDGSILLEPEMGSELVAIGDPKGDQAYVMVVELPERGQ
jgi:hypothetical protein